MRWELKGADRQTGKDVRLDLEADTESDAVKAAGARGMLVEAARKLPPAARTLTVGYAEPSTPKAAAPLPPPDPTAALFKIEQSLPTTGEGFAMSACTVFAALSYAGGLLALIQGCDGSYHPKRFQEDNAIGATANAVEAIVRESENWKPFLAGMILMVLGALWQLTANVVRSRASTRALAILLIRIRFETCARHPGSRRPASFSGRVRAHGPNRMRITRTDR